MIRFSQLSSSLVSPLTQPAPSPQITTSWPRTPHHSPRLHPGMPVSPTGHAVLSLCAGSAPETLLSNFIRAAPSSGVSMHSIYISHKQCVASRNRPLPLSETCSSHACDSLKLGTFLGKRDALQGSKVQLAPLTVVGASQTSPLMPDRPLSYITTVCTDRDTEVQNSVRSVLQTHETP